MNDGEFEWDDRKASENWLKHGISFEVAKSVFDDVLALEQLDDTELYDENRFSIIGMVENRLLYVAYTFRSNIRRIISARYARSRESRQYHEQNSD